MFPPTSTLASTQHSVSDLKRTCVKFAPNICGDFFLQYASQSEEVNDNEKQRAQILKGELKMMFQSSIYQNIDKILNLIDLVQRFGISYNFQQEINQALEQIHSTFTKNNIIKEDDNHKSLALLFRLLRQQGYRISSKAFSKLKNEQGNFSEILANDVQGLCNLYEAAHMRTHEDDILEEVYDFSNTQLKFLANQQSPSVATQINHCLRKPFNKSVPRFDARYHMTLYEQDPSHNESLLTFGKMDFIVLQKLYQKEIGSITEWWRKGNFVKNIPFARDRLVESYIWSLTMSDKPEHSNGRIFAAKAVSVFALVDDIYDDYGTIQELELFTEALQRWDINVIGSLPQPMKVVFGRLVELCQEIELMTTESGKSTFVVPYFKKVIFDLIKGYMVELKWRHDDYIPTYDEYKVNGVLTVGLPVFLIPFIGPGKFATEDVFNWIFSYPNIIEVVSLIGRFLNDIGSHKFEQERVHVASGVECCMKQYGISQVQAYDVIQRDVDHYWKVVNEECLKLNDTPKFVLDCVVNLARSFEFIYGDQQDKFTNGELLKDFVSSLLVDPMCIDQHK